MDKHPFEELFPRYGETTTYGTFTLTLGSMRYYVSSNLLHAAGVEQNKKYSVPFQDRVQYTKEFESSVETLAWLYDLQFRYELSDGLATRSNQEKRRDA